MAPPSNSTAPLVHVLLPASILERSPSLQDGVPADVECAHRFFGCELIQEAGVLLRLPQVVMATAQTMLHRFFYRKSLRDFDAFRVAFACLFLAAKVEERHKRIKDVLSVFYALYRRRKWGKTSAKQQLLDLEGSTYCLWRDWLVLMERQILIDLGFSVYNVAEHPHKYILYYVKIIGGSKELAQKAWGYINDSLRIDLCVRYRSEVIACAAIFLASRFLQIKLPDDPHWYALFGVDKRELHDASIAIMELYSREKVRWLEPLTEVNPFAVDDSSSSSSSSHNEGEDGQENANGAALETKTVIEQVAVSPVGLEDVGDLESAQPPPAAAATATVAPELPCQEEQPASPVEGTEETESTERTTVREDAERELWAPHAVAVETAIATEEAEVLASAVRIATGTATKAAVARLIDDETSAAAGDAAVEAAARVEGGDTHSASHSFSTVSPHTLCKSDRDEEEERKNSKMTLSMHEEAAYEDELIDEFDAPNALLSDWRESLSHTQQHRQQQLPPSPPPLVSAQSLQYQSSLASAPVASAPEPAAPEPAAPWETTRRAGALYPSFEELNGSGGGSDGGGGGGGGGARRASGSGAPFSTPSVASPYGAVATQSPPRPPPLPPAQQQHSKVQYSSMELGSEQIGPRGRNRSRDHEYPTVQALHRTQDSDIPVKQTHPVQSRTPHRAEAAERSESFRSPVDPPPEHQQQGEPVAPVEDEPETLPMLSQHEFEVKQKEIAQELRGYEQQLDYLAHALVGDTPHQKEERKRRELERREREHQRLVAIESRVQHQIERAHDREIRRAKVLERARRASRSSSPDMRPEDEKTRGEEREEEENVEPQKDTFKANFVG